MSEREASKERVYNEWARKRQAEEADTLRGMARRLREGFYSDQYDDEFEEVADLFEAAAADMEDVGEAQR